MQEITKEAKEIQGDSRIFSGEVRVTMLFEKNAWRDFSGARVHFSPKARSAWHTHPAGQTLIVTQGVIYTGTKNGIVHKAEMGESISCPPNVAHWHGAGLESSGTQIALAYLLAKKPYIVPLFGTTNPTHLLEDVQSLQVTLTRKDIKWLDSKLDNIAIVGDRYPPEQAQRVGQ